MAKGEGAFLHVRVKPTIRTQNSEIIYLTQLLYKRFHIYIFKYRYFDGLGRHLLRQNFVTGTDATHDDNIRDGLILQGEAGS